jgi:D-tyrosyl-tRNA(Tyr) deacylase
MVVLLGVGHDDMPEDARLLARKCAELRVFDDDEGRMNRSMIEIGGAMLVISQFTLLADCRKGRRPSFSDAAQPQQAQALYEVFVESVRAMGIPTATGRFREHMHVALVNDGPVTVLLDSRDFRKKAASSASSTG